MAWMNLKKKLKILVYTINQPGVREAVAVTKVLEEFWNVTSDTLAPFVIWRYVGTKQGVFRGHPPHRMSTNYDPVARPWSVQCQLSPPDSIQ